MDTDQLLVLKNRKQSGKEEHKIPLRATLRRESSRGLDRREEREWRLEEEDEASVPCLEGAARTETAAREWADAIETRPELLKWTIPENKIYL